MIIVKANTILPVISKQEKPQNLELNILRTKRETSEAYIQSLYSNQNFFKQETPRRFAHLYEFELLRSSILQEDKKGRKWQKKSNSIMQSISSKIATIKKFFNLLWKTILFLLDPIIFLFKPRYK